MSVNILAFIKCVKNIRNVLDKISPEDYLIQFDDLITFYEFNEIKIEVIDQIILQYRYDTDETKFQIILNTLIRDLQHSNKILIFYLDKFNKVDLEKIINSSLTSCRNKEEKDYLNLTELSKKNDEISKKVTNLCYHFDDDHSKVINAHLEEEVLKKEYEELKRKYLISYNQYNSLRNTRAKYLDLDFRQSRKLISDCLLLINTEYIPNVRFKENILDDNLCKVGYDILKDLVESEFSTDTVRELINMKYENSLKLKSKSIGKFCHFIKKIREFVPQKENSMEVWEEYIIEVFGVNFNMYRKKNNYEVKKEYAEYVDKKINALRYLVGS